MALAILGIGSGSLWSLRTETTEADATAEETPKNPLELSAALLFGVLFVVMLIGTHYALIYLGRTGFYTLAALMGVTDVDPFILSLTQSAGTATPVTTAAAAIAIAASSNNAVKGIYARAFSNKRCGTESLVLLIVFALLGLAALAW
jgi:uncharacterized membrane protein (DUF4010 family)